MVFAGVGDAVLHHFAASSPATPTKVNFVRLGNNIVDCDAEVTKVCFVTLHY